MGQSAGGLTHSTWFGEAICTCREPHESLPAEDCASQEGSPNEVSVVGDSKLSDTDGLAKSEPSNAVPPGEGVTTKLDSTGSSEQLPEINRTMHRSWTTHSTKTDMSLARMRLRGAIQAVQFTNRMAKNVRFSEETVHCFEVKSEGSSAYKGLTLGDKVVWNDADDDVPKGTVGEITGFNEGGIVQVRFPKGTWDFRAAELSTQDSWSTGVARAALSKAERFMRDMQVLEAESVLAEALNKLNEAVALEHFEDVRELTLDAQKELPDSDTSLGGPSTPGTPGSANSGSGSGSNTPTTSQTPVRPSLQRSNSAPRLQRGSSRDLSGARSPGLRRASLLSQNEASEARAAIARMQSSIVYKEVERRAGQYHNIGRALSSTARGRIYFSSPSAELWVHCPAGASWFEFRLACDLGEASLKQCVAASMEPELIPKLSSGKPSPPARGVHPSVAIKTMPISFLIYRKDTPMERFRWFNTEYGFFAESLTSDLAAAQSIPSKEKAKPKEPPPPVPTPTKGSSSRKANGHLIWIPRGGGQPGTIAVQFWRVDVGSRLARLALGTLATRSAKALLEELRVAVARAGEPEMRERVASDKLGFYAQLAPVEAAAQKRASLSLATLPGEDVVKRPYFLPSAWP